MARFSPGEALVRNTRTVAEMGTDRHEVAVCDLGCMPYADAWALQQSLQRLLIRAKRGETDMPVPNFLLMVEHPPVYTLGKSGDEGNLLASESDLVSRGASFFHTDRGGDVTFHGPGQLVGYPILDLDRFFTDIGRYLRKLEEVIIRVCRTYGLSADRVPGRTGVWIDVESGAERKICAFGIRCSRWVTMHGFAFNVNTDLGFYDSIIPCGISDRGITSLAIELGRAVDPVECRSRVIEAFTGEFESSTFELDLGELEELVGAFES